MDFINQCVHNRMDCRNTLESLGLGSGPVLVLQLCQKLKDSDDS